MTPLPSKNIPELHTTQTNKRQPQLVLIIQENSQPFPKVLKLHSQLFSIPKMKGLYFQHLISPTLFYLQNFIYLGNNILQSGSGNLSSKPTSFTEVALKQTFSFISVKQNKNDHSSQIHCKNIYKYRTTLVTSKI